MGAIDNECIITTEVFPNTVRRGPRDWVTESIPRVGTQPDMLKLQGQTCSYVDPDDASV